MQAAPASSWNASNLRVLELFPLSAHVDDGELTLGGVSASRLAAEYGTPLVVYCEQTIRAQAQAYRAAAPEAVIAYGTKAFPNVTLLRILAEEGVGADVSTLGELAVAQAAGIVGERILFHGNNKSDDELRAAAEAGATVVLDAPDEPGRAAAAGVRRALVRLTPGVEAVTHESIQTAHEGSKFGLAADPALAVIDATVRLLPGAMSDMDSARTDSFFGRGISAPSYTRPPEYRGLEVPPVLLSGNHAEIDEWRHRMGKNADERRKGKQPIE